MAQFGQPQTGYQGEQPAVGKRSGVVLGSGFAPESKAHRLGRASARQVVGAIPGASQCQHQHGHKRKAHCHVRMHCGGQQLQTRGAQPIGQQARVLGWPARQSRVQPAAVPVGDFAHVRDGHHIVVAPGIPSHKSGQDIDGTHQQQHRASEPAHAVLGNKCRAGGAHG